MALSETDHPYVFDDLYRILDSREGTEQSSQLSQNCIIPFFSGQFHPFTSGLPNYEAGKAVLFGPDDGQCSVLFGSLTNNSRPSASTLESRVTAMGPYGDCPSPQSLKNSWEKG